MQTPRIIIQQDEWTRYGLVYDDHCVAVLRSQVKHTADSGWGSWEYYSDSHLPPCLAPYVSPFYADEFAREAKQTARIWDDIDHGRLGKQPIVQDGAPNERQPPFGERCPISEVH